MLACRDVDWIVTNPPFSKAAEVLAHGLVKARRGVALLMRIQWLEGEKRWVTLRVSTNALRTIEKNGLDVVLADMRARGQKV